MQDKPEIRNPKSEGSPVVNPQRRSGPFPVSLRINGRLLTVNPGTLLAAAVARAGVTSFRRSVVGQARGPLCGMGVCMECRVTIDGVTHCRSCLIVCREGMDVTTS